MNLVSYIHKTTGEHVKITENPTFIHPKTEVGFYLVYSFDKTFGVWQSSYAVSRNSYPSFLEQHTKIDNDYILKQIQERLDTVFNELLEKELQLRSETLYVDDPNKYNTIEFVSYRLDGRLEELRFIKELLEHGNYSNVI